MVLRDDFPFLFKKWFFPFLLGGVFVFSVVIYFLDDFGRLLVAGVFLGGVIIFKFVAREKYIDMREVALLARKHACQQELGFGSSLDVGFNNVFFREYTTVFGTPLILVYFANEQFLVGIHRVTRKYAGVMCKGQTVNDFIRNDLKIQFDKETYYKQIKSNIDIQQRELEEGVNNA